MNEGVVELAALEWLQGLGYQLRHGPEITPGQPGAERTDYGKVVLDTRLRAALKRLNPHVPAAALDDAFRKLTRPDSPSLVQVNHTIHRYFVEGVPVEYRRGDGSTKGDLVQVFDYEKPENNEFLAVNQFTVIEGGGGGHERRPDVVVLVNGLPIAVIELKNAADAETDTWRAFNQIQTYKQQVPSLFAYNAINVISDGVTARVGTLTASREWFMPWRTTEGEALAPESMPQLQVVLEGIFEKCRLLDLIRHFIVFEEADDGTLVKKMAGYHQYHAVNGAMASTIAASRETGDKRVGVIWHTQGSGKSLTMAFYTGKVVVSPEMENPTVVVLTDRNDLDQQLFGTFSRCREILRQAPVQADSRAHLRELLLVASGGVVFTTVQKFFAADDENRHPTLSQRRNIVVIADEAHRSQYDFIDGYARHMRDALPNASFIGFTGTPIELTDASTKAVFGDYVSVYDIQRAVNDGATVPIYYESRLAKIRLDEAERPRLDPEFEEVTEGEETERKEKLKTKWAALEALVGAEKRLELIAEDLAKHFEERLEAMDGKAMIVCMSRRICVELYEQIRAFRPRWHSDDDKTGAMKIVMTGAADDPPEWQPHIRTKGRREELAQRYKNATDPFKIVIVRDMWLTGFDAPAMHTMYMDKPMRGHGLMQAIARVNRVFKDKPGGLVVDYLGLADQLKAALRTYTQSGGKGETAIDQEQAVAAMQEKYEVVRAIFDEFDWSLWASARPQERLSILPAAQEHVLAQSDGRNRLHRAVVELSKAFALAVPHERAMAIRDDVGFFQAVDAVLSKRVGERQKSPYEIDHAIRQMVSRAVAPEGMIDIFAAAGLKKPDISILSDEFLADVKAMPQQNLAVEMLRKLLEGEIRTRSRKNVVQSRSFAEMLEKSLTQYKNRAIQTAQVIEELVALAREMREANRRGEQLGLTEDEVAFYDALEVNDSAVKVLGDATLKLIAQELVKSVKSSVTIDWTVRENVRAQMRVIIKRILRKYGYPPDKQARATDLVLEQAEVLCRDWADQTN